LIPRREITGFRFDPEKDAAERYLRLQFFFETSKDPEWVAASFCAEQSTAQWSLPGSRDDLRPRHAAKLVSLRVVEEADRPLYDLPSTKGEKRFFRCLAEIAHPHENFGPRIANLLSAIAGEGVFYAPWVHTIQLLDVGFPELYLKNFQGPRYGIEGLRERLKVRDRPFFIGVVKPNIGLDPRRFSQLAERGLEGGLDIAKDDEMQADAPWSPLSERLRWAGEACRQASEKAGCPKMFIANITDEEEKVLENAQIAVKAGVGAVMINPLMTGFSSLRKVRREVSLPMMGHFTGMALWGRHPHYGVKSRVLTKLMRLCGCDLIGIAGFGKRMQTTAEEVLECIDACLQPLGPLLPALPIPGGGDWAATLSSVHSTIGHSNFGFIAGRGVFGHPDGPGAGALSIRQAWEACRQKISLGAYAETHPELKRAIEAFSLHEE